MGAPVSADDPVSDCEKFTTATARAEQLMAVLSGTYGPVHTEFRVNAAHAVLAVLFHAAALGGVGVKQVCPWLTDSDASREQIQQSLQRSTEPRYTFNSLLYLYGPPSARRH